MTAAIAGTALAVVALLLAEQANAQRGVWIAKPLASLGFIAVACAAGALESSYGQRVLVGLVACALGDVLLIPRGAGATFLSGMASFALGHAAYAYAFARHGVAPTPTWVAIGLMVVVAIATLRWLSPRLPREMQIPIVVYIVVISCMVAFAVGASFASGDFWVAIGAIAFATSDLAVARERFVHPAFVNQLWGLPLYYGAQVVLACSV
jgi:uncharacterized membrane protein YhhN